MGESLSFITEICEHSLCTACQACQNSCSVGAISIQEDEKGFYYPHIDSAKCVGCNKCRMICPMLNRDYEKRIPLKVFAGWIKDNANRNYSTSGGASYALSKMIVENGGYFCGVRWNIDHAEHYLVDKCNELHQFQGSKYAFSNIGDCYKRIKVFLKQGKTVMFVGTGCQIAGLKAIVHDNTDHLITVDILCHGIPSQRALRERIEQIENESGKKVVNLRFREKKEDQYHSCAKYEFDDGTACKVSEFEDLFLRGFNDGYLLRPNCFKCSFAGPERVSDITLADFWGYTPKRFSYISYNKGVSLIIANTKEGLSLINNLKGFKLEQRHYDFARKSNQSLNAPSIKPIDYDSFWTRYLGGEMISTLSLGYFPPLQIPPVRKNGWRVYCQILFGERFTMFLNRCVKVFVPWLKRNPKH